MSSFVLPTGGWRAIPLRGLAAPLFIVVVLATMILPLPPFLLDLLFTFNIALALIVLLASVYANRPMDFAAFPTVLLLTTLLRLSLNVASTRVVLLNGHSGPDAAGKVIEAFGHFLVGGNFAVGIVVFLILVVINFVVITKGAGRIAEVAARFTLDAMPGKQMAIDADMNAGLITEIEARTRRTEIAREADFYGAMDGASKFVRGDAIAGMLILVINIVGGLAIGLLQHDLSLATATNNYVLLAIGDGLVAQIPALVISVAAGLVVSRVGAEENVKEDIGTQVVRQLVRNPQTMMVTGGVLLILGLIPGMPHFVFILFGGGAAWAGWWQTQAAARAARGAAAATPVAAPDAGEASWEDLTPVDVLGLEVGYRLIPLVDRNQDGDLLKRIKAIRKKFAQEVGFLPPQVHIRDNLELKPNGYRISLKGVVIGEGEVFAGMYMAINPGNAVGQLPGAAARDPAFGLPATWIEGAFRDQALSSGFTVVDAGTVVATHLNHLMQSHAGALLGRSETQALIEHFGKQVPKLIDDLVPKLIPLSTFTRVLQALLEEGVHIRDLRSIVETLTEHAAKSTDAAELTAQVRIALGRAIIQMLFGPATDIEMLVLEPDLERVLIQASAGGAAAEPLGLEPGLAENLLRDLTASAQRLENLGQPPTLLVPDRLRPSLARMARRAMPRLKVIAHAEIPEACTIRVAGVVGARGVLPA